MLELVNVTFKGRGKGSKFTYENLVKCSHLSSEDREKVNSLHGDTLTYFNDKYDLGVNMEDVYFFYENLNMFLGLVLEGNKVLWVCRGDRVDYLEKEIH